MDWVACSRTGSTLAPKSDCSCCWRISRHPRRSVDRARRWAFRTGCRHGMDVYGRAVRDHSIFIRWGSSHPARSFPLSRSQARNGDDGVTASVGDPDSALAAADRTVSAIANLLSDSAYLRRQHSIVRAIAEFPLVQCSPSGHHLRRGWCRRAVVRRVDAQWPYHPIHRIPSTTLPMHGSTIQRPGSFPARSLQPAWSERYARYCWRCRRNPAVVARRF